MLPQQGFLTFKPRLAYASVRLEGSAETDVEACTVSGSRWQARSATTVATQEGVSTTVFVAERRVSGVQG